MQLTDKAREIVNQVALAMETGEIRNWLRPWDLGALMPTNQLTRQAYRGINIILLWAVAMKRQYQGNRWLTMVQKDELAHALGVQLVLRKGEKAAHILRFIDHLPSRYEETTDPDVVRCTQSGDVAKRDAVTVRKLRTYAVFHVSQIDGWPDEVAAEFNGLLRTPVSDEAAAIASDALAQDVGAKVIASHQAFWQPSTDTIGMPPLSVFKSGPDYAATLYHELVHWTAPAHRCDRKTKGSLAHIPGIEASFKEEYAFEELVAEFGSALLCAQAGITANLQHEDYLVGWAKRIRQDPYTLVMAASQAERAMRWLIAEQNNRTSSQPAAAAAS